MSLAPRPADLVARALGDLRGGLPVVLAEGGAGLLALAAEVARDDRVAAFAAMPGAAVAVTARRAETLKARAYDGDLARIALPAGADAGLVQALADPARDLATPLKGPFATRREGAADLHRLALRLAKRAELLPAVLAAPVQEPRAMATALGLTLLDRAEAEAALDAAGDLGAVSAARLPMAVSRAGRLRVFRPEGGGPEHYAVEIGRPDPDRPVLARLHSACFTGDVLGSLKCDCGPQLHAALEAMAAEGAGVLLYLNQEGRGIGLANKMRAYALQDQGFDTVEANHRLGFEDDERDFRLGARMLSAMGIAQVRLMTNNPRKVAMLEGMGVRVAERVPLVTARTDDNAGYLATKAAKSGHLL